MTSADVWTVIIATLGGQSALLGIAGALAKRLIDAKYKEQEERLSYQLNKKLSTFSSRQSVFHKQQADAFAQLYALMWTAYEKAFPLWDVNSPTTLQNLRQQSDDALLETNRFYAGHRFYFDEESAKCVGAIIGSLQRLKSEPETGPFPGLRPYTSNELENIDLALQNCQKIFYKVLSGAEDREST